MSYSKRRQHEQNVGKFMTEDLKFEYELKELGLSLYQFNKRKDELFTEALSELAFKPRPRNVIDKKIAFIMKHRKIKDIPIVHLKEDLYFVGLYKVHLKLMGDYLCIQVGTKQWERFAEYIKAQREKITQRLTLFSIKNEDIPIVEVVNRIVSRQPLQGHSMMSMTN